MLDVWGVAAILAKLVLYLSFIGATGVVIIGCVYSGLVARISPELKRQTIVLACLALVAAVIGFLLRGAALKGEIDGMVDPEMLGLLWQTSVGYLLVCQVLAAVLLLFGCFVPRFGRWIALCGGLLALWSFALIGHVPELGRFGFQVVLFLHLLCAAFWLGVFAPLRRMALEPGQLLDAAELGHRFGKVGVLVVPLLVAAGLVMAWALVGSIQALFATGYGRALLFKIFLVGLLLIFAAFNKLQFVPALRSGDARAGQRLTRSIELEFLTMVVVLATTATLTSVLTPPS
ncbi:copper resistance D family protein [Ruegeria sp. HKCCC1038]|uniref:copper resistance D family protein n=1 Tax=Ruegeria sp. HKCCC1038 TaxID=2682982 RepID=UPI001489A446|nr:CopD family protein [Ruegeria sp. HKCCC1038]